MGSFSRLREWARLLKSEMLALYLAYRDPRTPWYAKLLAGLVVAYAMSPIDLIPDPIPVVGYLDDLILLPVGILIARRLIPSEVMEDCRSRAVHESDFRKTNWIVAMVIVGVWLLTFVGVAYCLFKIYY